MEELGTKSPEDVLEELSKVLRYILECDIPCNTSWDIPLNHEGTSIAPSIDKGRSHELTPNKAGVQAHKTAAPYPITVEYRGCNPPVLYLGYAW